MGFDAFAEPLIVLTILTAGVLLNRRPSPTATPPGSPRSVNSNTRLLPPTAEPQWRERKLLGRTVRSRNTARWSETAASRILARFPFLVEVWYWLLVYWVSS